MNNRAEIYHWIFFVMLGALIVFFTSFNQNVHSNEKGVWQTQFLEQNYLVAEKELLRNDIIITKVASEVAHDIALQGGFARGSECGKFKDVNLWNNPERWCLPDATTEAAGLSEMRVKAALPTEQYSNFRILGTQLKAQGVTKTIVSEVGKYTYDTSFAADMSYSFAEFDQLRKEALLLIGVCADNADLTTCIHSHKQSHWSVGLCEKDEQASGSVAIFCVSSPNRYNVYLDSKSVPVRYQFALNFEKKIEYIYMAAS